MRALPVLDERVSLAERTTLGVGGPARFLARCPTPDAVREALALADARGLPTLMLGGGSNVLVADAGFAGVAIEYTDEMIRFEPESDGEGGTVLVRAGAGASWDALVARAVAAGLGGLECLSGIPGRVGAAPIQNVGAYGQEVAATIRAVHALERTTGARRAFTADECGFAYRTSRFKATERDRWAIVAVDFALAPAARGAVRYADLERHFAKTGADSAQAPTLEAVRAAVLEIRRAKSMVIGDLGDPGDPNRRSAGSFFTNPIVDAARAEAVAEAARRAGAGRAMPAYPAGGSQVKLSAAWLIEAAGFRRGHRRGRAGLSSNHALALINRGGASAAELVDLARAIRAAVRARFAVTLVPEPVFVGFADDVDTLLG